MYPHHQNSIMLCILSNQDSSLIYLQDTRHHSPLQPALPILIISHPLILGNYNSNFDILNDMQFETVLQMVHSGIVGAIWSAPRCRLYANPRQNDGGPPPLRSIQHMNGLPGISPHPLLQVQESQEIHGRSSMLCTAVFQQGSVAGKEQPLNSLAWQEPFHQQFLQQCSRHFVASPACKWGIDWFKIAHTLFDPEAGQVGRKMTEVPSPEVSFDLNAFTHYSAGVGSKNLTVCSRISARFVAG